MNNKFITILFFVFSAISLVLAITNKSIIAVLGCSFFSLLGLVFWKFGSILFPYFTSFQKIIERRGPYEIPPNREYITKRVGGRFFVAYFLGVFISESTSEKSQREKELYVERFERAITGLKPLTKFSVLVGNLDISKHLDKIKARRSIAETKRARLLSEGNKRDAEVSILDREIAMWNRQIKRITSGDKPIEILSYVMVVSDGSTLEEAIGGAYSRAKEAKAVISNSLACDVKILKGEEMLKCFEWEFMLPADISELEDEVF